MIGILKGDMDNGKDKDFFAVDSLNNWHIQLHLHASFATLYLPNLLFLSILMCAKEHICLILMEL